MDHWRQIVVVTCEYVLFVNLILNYFLLILVLCGFSSRGHHVPSWEYLFLFNCQP